tara:strand:+ start:380 stop:637 length:258 start_codon:yes stop_codon:yes gene_type:complete
MLFILFLINIIYVISFTNLNRNIINNAYLKIKKEIKTDKEYELIEKFKDELFEISERQKKIEDMVNSFKYMKKNQDEMQDKKDEI